MLGAHRWVNPCNMHTLFLVGVATGTACGKIRCGEKFRIKKPYILLLTPKNQNHPTCVINDDDNDNEEDNKGTKDKEEQ